MLALTSASLVAISGCGLSTGGTGADSALFGPSPPGAGGGEQGASGTMGTSGATGTAGNGTTGKGGSPTTGKGGSGASGGATVGLGGGTAQGGKSVGQGGTAAGQSGAPIGQGGGPVGQGGGPVGQGGGPVGQGGAPAGPGGAPVGMGPVGTGGAPVGQGGAPVGPGPGGAPPGPGGAPVGQGGSTTTAGTTGSAGTTLTGPCQTPPGGCVQSLPSGWTLAAYENNHNQACPAAFATHDVVSNPMAAGGACSCGCAVNPTPSCTKGPLATFYGDNKCDTSGASLDVNGSGCTSLGGTASLANFFSATPVPLDIGCSVSINSDSSKITATADRICDASTACEEDVCKGMVGPGFKACVYSLGDVMCPAGWGNRTVVGDEPSFACGACGSCVATASCTGETIKLYADSQCLVQVASLDASGKCVQPNANSASAFKYTANVTNPKCEVMGGSMATVGVTNPRTVCCK